MTPMNKLMKIKLMAGGTILMLTAKSAFGENHLGNDQSQPHAPQDTYRACELSLDVFGSGSIGKYTINHLSGARIKQDGELGAGVGLTYFITRNFGIGAEAYSENTTGVFVDSASANVIARLPLGQSGFAPYAFGGGGRQFDLAEVWFAQAGAGLEYRFTPKVGVFTDVRWVLPEETKYFGVGRLGMRFSF